MMGIRNGRQAQLDNTMPPAVAWAERRPRASATWSSHRKTHRRRPTCSPTCHARWPTPTQCSRGSTWPRSRRAWRSRASPSRASGPLPRRGALCDAHRADHLDREASTGVGARMRAGLRASNRRARHLPMRYETGLPSSVIRFRTLHASTASRRCPDELRARRQSPTIDVDRKNACSTRAC